MPIQEKIAKAKRIQLEQQIASEIAKITKRNTGKGPRCTKARILEDIIEIYMDGFLTDLEHCLLENEENRGLIEELRKALRNTMHQAYIEILSPMLQMNLRILHVHMDIQKDSCKITLIIV
ncbi:MAG: Na-translocating system protein MpsC family protein [Thermotaleaceae bacterium]